MALDKVKNELHRCISCSECYGRGPWLPFADGADTITDWVCPTLDHYGFLSHTARGKQYLAREIAYGKMDVDADIVRIFFSCPDCGVCDTLCPYPHHDILRAMRKQIAESGRLPPGNKEQNEKIVRAHNIFGADQKNRTRWAAGLDIPRRGKVVYFAGCHASYRQPDSARAAIKLMRKAGLEVAYLGEEEWCCGYHAAATGCPEIAFDMAKHNLEAIAGSGAHQVVFSCPACYASFKVECPEAPGKPAFLSMSEMVAMLLKDGRLKFREAPKQRVAYHDPCLMGRQHLGRRNDVYQAPREVIAALPGIEFIELERRGRWADCCGSGCDVVSAAYPEVTGFMAGKRIRQARDVDTLLTTCPRCVETLGWAGKQADIKTMVKDLTQFAAELLA